MTDVIDKEFEDKLNQRLNLNFEKNMQCFKELIPYIYELFDNYEPKNGFTLTVTKDKLVDFQFANGHLLYNCDNPQQKTKEHIKDYLDSASLEVTRYSYQKDYFGQIHHRYLNEVKDIIDNKVKPKEKAKISDLGVIPMLFHIGVGLGYSLEALYEVVDIKNIYIIEPDSDVFYASLHTFDWTSLLNYVLANNIYLNIQIGDEQEVLNNIDLYLKNHGKFLGGAASFYVHYSSDKIDNLLAIIKKNYNQINMALGFIDDNLFSISHASHVILDKRSVVNALYDIPQSIADIPVFIVGNGPSLDNDIAFLRKNQDKAFIVACGTTIDTLYNAGIKPDVLASTERISQVANILDAVNKYNFLDDILLVATDVVHPNTTKLFKRTAIFSKIDEPFAWLFEKNKDKYPQLANYRKLRITNPLVANLAVSAMLEFGFNNIYLFGLDNGSRVKDKIHSKHSNVYGSLGYESYGTYYNLDDLVDGNFGGKISSNSIYKLSVSMINTIVDLYRRSYPERDIKFSNCSDGARIDVARPVYSNTINMDDKAPLDKEGIRVIFDNTLTYKIDLNEDDINTLIDKEHFNKIVDDVIAKLSKKFDNRVDYVANLQDLSQDCSELSYFKDVFYGFTINGSLNTFLLTIADALFSLKDTKEAIEVADEIKERLIYLLEDSKKLFSYLPHYIMTEHKEILHGKCGFDHEHSKAPDIDYEYDKFVRENKEKLKEVQPFVKRYE